MTDKIITTLETTIMWICPSDQLPEDFEEVLLYTKDKYLGKGLFLDYTAIDETSKFSCTETYYTPDEVLWWASLPKFD